MKIKNVTEEEIQQALKKINEERYQGNIVLATEHYAFKSLHDLFGECRIIVEAQITLETEDYERPGYSRTPSKQWRQRHACWHAHGHLFDALLVINPEAVISTCYTKRIDRDGGNWRDWERGGIYNRMWQSHLCDCH